MITGEVRSDEDAKAAHFVTLTLDLGADREGDGHREGLVVGFDQLQQAGAFAVFLDQPAARARAAHVEGAQEGGAAEAEQALVLFQEALLALFLLRGRRVVAGEEGQAYRGAVHHALGAMDAHLASLGEAPLQLQTRHVRHARILQ